MATPEELPADSPRASLRRIRTARSLRSINSGVRQGFLLLFRQVVPSPLIRAHYRLMRNRRTGEVVDHVDPLDELYDSPSWELVLTQAYYPYHFKSPYAAYLIPKGIEVGEEVWVQDLIEDYVGGVGESGDTYRLESCVAVWDGADLVVRL